MTLRKKIFNICIFTSFWWALTQTEFVYAAAPSMNFTVNMSEVVNVNTGGGTPRITLDVGGNTRYASYVSGTGTSALTFTYTATAGDLDLDGITVTPASLDLNGGAITDLNGNALSPLTFTAPTTTGVKVDYPTLSMDFTNGTTGRYTLNGTVYTTLASFLTAAGTSFTRTSTATYFDSTGTLQTASNNVPRFDYNPSTLSFRGLLMERSRTNSIRNSTMQNAIAGTPGTMPTNWVAITPSNGLSRIIVGTGTVNGMSYIDIQYSGTTTATSFTNITFDVNNQIAALNTQTWTHSAHVSLVGGSLSNLTSLRLRSAIFSSGVSYLAEVVTNGTALEGINSTLTRYTGTGTIANASSAFIQPYIQFSYNTGSAINFTIRIAAPQLERSTIPTSFIPTTNAAVTRSDDVMNIPTGSWYNQSAGGFYSHTEWASTTGANFPMLARFDDTGNNNRWNIYYNQGTNIVGISGHNGGVTQGVFSSATQSTSGSIKGAAAQATNSANAAYNGTLSTLDTVWSPPTVTQWTTDASNAQIWTKVFKYYPLRVTDTQLQLLTQ